MDNTLTLWVAVGVFGAFMGFAAGAVLEYINKWGDKLPMLTAALCGTLGALLYFLIWDTWSEHEDCGLHPVVFFLAAVGGGILGWANGPRKTPEKEREEREKAWQEWLERAQADLERKEDLARRNLPPLGRQLKREWQKTRRPMVRELANSGILYQTLHVVAHRGAARYHHLRDCEGLIHEEAMDLVWEDLEKLPDEEITLLVNSFSPYENPTGPDREERKSEPRGEGKRGSNDGVM